MGNVRPEVTPTSSKGKAAWASLRDKVKSGKEKKKKRKEDEFAVEVGAQNVADGSSLIYDKLQKLLEVKTKEVKNGGGDREKKQLKQLEDAEDKLEEFMQSLIVYGDI